MRSSTGRRLDVRRPASLVCVVALLCATTAAADVLEVPSDFATIQAAVDAAAPGDTVRVGPGVWRENVVVSVPGLVLRGTRSVIDGSGEGPCVQVVGEGPVPPSPVHDVELRGLRLVNGTNAVRATGDRLVVRDVVMEGSSGAAVLVGGDNARLSGNRITACQQAFAVTAGVTSHTVIERNRVEGAVVQSLVQGGAFTLDRNRFEACVGGGVWLIATHAVEPTTVSRNRLEFLGATGLAVTATAGGGALVERNRVELALGTGLSIGGFGPTAARNTLSRCTGTSLRAAATGGRVLDNRIRSGAGIGIDVEELGAGRVEGNRVERNLGDGLRFSGSDGSLLGNRLVRNGQDGIDVVDGEGNALLDNVCSRNGHEGIDNSGVGTTILGNTARGNALGAGPDIAGAGDGGVGSVAPYTGAFDALNDYGTGGPTTPSRLDID